jgi:predicted DNA-binding transcriptional regulator YafY
MNSPHLMRIAQVWQIAQSKTPASTREIARALGCTQRTVQRDLQWLAAAGLEVARPSLVSHPAGRSKSHCVTLTPDQLMELLTMVAQHSTAPTPPDRTNAP